MKIRKVAKNTNFNLKKYTSWAILKVYLVFNQFLSANSSRYLRWKVLYCFLLIYPETGHGFITYRRTGKCLIICDASRDLKSFVQFKKKHEKHPWRSITFAFSLQL